jgi:hypothetical protein
MKNYSTGTSTIDTSTSTDVAIFGFFRQKKLFFKPKVQSQTTNNKSHILNLKP